MATATSRRMSDGPEFLRLPPHSIESEQAVLGGLLLDTSAWDAVADLIQAPDFYRRDHQLIFEAIAAVVEQRSPCDAITVSEALSRRGHSDEVGGLAYLARLAKDTPSAANVRAYAEIVREQALLRTLVSAGGEIASSALDAQGRTASELVDEAERRVFEIAERGTRTRAGFQSVRDILPATIDRIDMLHHDPAAFTGVPTGYAEIDRLTTGFQRGDLIIIAGRPSMGKTTLAVNIAENAAIDRGMKVAIFSMEMSAEQVTLRMISSLGRVSQGPLRTGQLSTEDWPRITNAMEILSKAQIFVDETPALTPTDVRARARRLKREQGLDLIVVDYLQLMQVAGTKENRATEISEISRSLKALAKELHCPVVALSQLNRSVEQRTEKKPVMSDLRECVVGDTRVCLADGRRMPIRELVGQAPRVLAMDARQRIVAADSDRVWSVGTRPVFRVSLASGRRLTATGRHRVYTDGGWRKIADLGPGARCAVARALPAAERPIDWPDPEVVPGRLVVGGSDPVHRPLRYARGSGEKGAAVRAAAATLRARLESTGANPNVDTLPFEAFADLRRATAAGGVGARRSMAAGGVGARRTDSALYWDRVIAIEPAGEAEVFDLTVPGPASWLADGLVSHNSGAIEQDADLILMIYREEVYDANTTRKGIADVIVTKQRNGPTGEVHLAFLGEYTRFENLVAEAYGEGAFR